MKRKVKPEKKKIEKKKGYTCEEILNLLDLNKKEEKAQNERIPAEEKNTKEKKLHAKDKNEGPKELIEDKRNLSKEEINELINILEEIPNTKMDMNDKVSKKKDKNNKESDNNLKILEKNTNEIQKTEVKIEQKEENVVTSLKDDSSESEKIHLFDAGVHQNKGFADINYFRRITEDNQGSNIFPISDFELENVEGDGNCGYRALALQIYGDEECHYKIREDIYNYLKINASHFSELNFQIEGGFVTANEYIEKVKEEGFWMGDLEISIVNKIYEASLYVYELRNDLNLYLLSKYGDINDDKKLFLNICFVNNNHYNILYEKKGDKINKKKI